MLVGMLIIIAFILAFAGVAALPGLADAISKISKAGPQ
jgi:hypothetical protein